ncbi:MAG TPA: helix-turn-helix domain-containing protein [Chloroflexota bacterium]|jgi:transcriptional regulator with XRE-family HTH domain|nr:helix-turn-helix domain-containing protein [Chloroflexota bacterium]
MQQQPSHPRKAASPFGERLRYWRHRSGLSQLELAATAATTPRHLSFVESGRSRPGRDLVLRLSAALDMPVRERNELLARAGLAPEYPSHDLDDRVMRPVNLVLDKVLATHEPYPAWVVAPGLRFIRSNRAAEALFPGMCDMQPEEIVDLWYGPGPFRQTVENWADVVWAAVATLRREAARSTDQKLLDLVRRAEAHLRTVPPPTPEVEPELPFVCARLKLGGSIVRTVSTVMRFDAAVEVTASELRVELLFPADDASDTFFQSLASSSVGMAAAMPAQSVGGAAKDGSER